MAYALFLAAEGRLPVQQAEAAASDVPGQGHQPPLAYALAAPAVAWLPPEERQILLAANPHFLWAGGDEPGAFMRASRELHPWPPLTTAWHLARSVSGLWGALAVLFTYLAARRLRPADPALALLAAAFVALNPQLLFITALVSNDPLLAALGAAILWWCLAPNAAAAPLRWALGAGLLFGLALLTKQSALLLGPVILLAGWRAAGGNLRRAAVVTAAWGGTALLMAGWWFLRNLALYGDLFGLAQFRAEFFTQPFAWDDPASWAAAAQQLFASFWARFGWMSLLAPRWAVWVYGIVCLLAAGGLVLEPRRALRRAVTSGWALPLVAAVMALVWAIAFAASAGVVAFQGRMLFPAVAAIALLLAGGLLALARRIPLRLRAALPAGVVALLAALALFMPLGVIRPAYSWVALAPDEARAALGTPVFARYSDYYEGGVILRGWRLDGPARPGAELPVTLTWNSDGSVPRVWTVFVHLVDASGQIVAQSNSQPRDGTLPFPTWTPGDWVADTHRLPLPAGLAPGDYELRVGLFRAETDGRRQRVWAEDNSRIGDQAVLGVVTVRP
jgi:hypothetical protein